MTHDPETRPTTPPVRHPTDGPAGADARPGPAPAARRGEEGFALLFVLLLAIAVAALAAGATMVQTNSRLMTRYQTRNSVLETVAEAGIEAARSRINATDSLYPDSGYTAVETDAPVFDAAGERIPNVQRTTWVGPTGITSGQYGVFGSVVVEVEDAFGNRLVRRQEIRQESFAKYAYFTDVEPSSIAFGGGDQIFGPVHSNDDIKIYSSGATFWNEVSTAGIVQDPTNGTFAEGFTENVERIDMPATAELDKLRAQAQKGDTYFSGSTTGPGGQATTRIEFVALDLDGDGETTGENEGFIRVYQSSDTRWVTGEVPSDYGGSWWSPGNGLRNSRNCGHFHTSTGDFVAAADHPASGPDSWVAAVNNSGRRCFLGGADELSGGFVADDGTGEWIAWSGSVDPALSGRPDAGHLIPVNRAMNPDFKGVVFVDGKVAVSGVVRGNVTLAATGEIIIADDVTYATDPGAGTCADLLGLFSGEDVIVADNTLNSPIRPQDNPGSNFRTFDDTKDEFVHGVVLALDEFRAENHDDPDAARTAEPCESDLWGRGCLYLTGGIIQRTRGPVGADWTGPGGSGYLKRYSYDACAASAPPPYFPTTGHFTRGVHYEIDPSGFDVDQLFDRLTPGSGS